MTQQTLMTDFEIMSDHLASQLGLCACLANNDLANHLLLLTKNTYELNGSVRANNTITQTMLETLEAEYMSYKTKLTEVIPFVLPQGSLLACHLHVARCIAKQVVRILSIINKDEKEVPFVIIAYAHLLANHLFVLARYVNQSLGFKEEPFVSRNYT